MHDKNILLREIIKTSLAYHQLNTSLGKAVGIEDIQTVAKGNSAFALSNPAQILVTYVTEKRAEFLQDSSYELDDEITENIYDILERIPKDKDVEDELIDGFVKILNQIIYK